MSEATNEDDATKNKWGGDGGGGGTRRNQRKAEKAERRREKEQIKLTALDNRTTFKTGWELTDETTAQMSLPPGATRVIHVPKVEEYPSDEQLVNMSEENRRELQWRQTQRRIYDDYVYTNKDDQVRQHQPNKKLQLNNKAEWNTSLVRVDGPTPVRSTKTIPDNGVREELDLMCLEDDKYLEALDYDIQGVQSRHVLSLGPGSSRHVRDYCRHRRNTEADRRRNNQNGDVYLDKAINCDSASTSTDPYGRIHAYYPDADNYKEEEDEFRQRILQNPANVTLSRFLNLRDTTSNFMCSLGTGLQTTIHLRDEEDNYTRILCITSMTHSQLVKGLMTHFPSFLGVRLLKSTERAYAIWKADELGIARILLVSCIPAYEVVFSSSQCGLAFCTKFANTQAFDAVMKYPVGLDDCSTPTRKEYYSLVLKWYPYPSEQKVDIYLKNPEDMGYAEQILNGHNLPCKIPDSVRYHPENRKMEGKFHKCSGNIGFDSHIAKRVLTQILFNNGIDLDRILFYRNRHRPFNDKHIRDRIHMRIGRAAFNAKVWKDSEYLPVLDQEWFVYIHGNEERLGWELELEPGKQGSSYQTKDYQRKATVIFDNAHVGKEVAEYMMDRTPHRDTFVLAERDDQGVHFFPVYTVRFDCPRPIRTVCDAALNSIDEFARAESDYEKKHWVRVRDFKHEDVLVVEGWPMEDVIAVAAQVKAVLRGRVVKCVEDNTDTSPGRLLYGCGLQHVNHLQNTHQRKVAMTLDRLHQEITMWGDEATMDIIEAELYNYASDRGSYTIEAQIIIGSPRFLPIFGEVLVFNTIQRISQAIGGAAVRIKHPHTLMFSGSVKQYEDLQKLLDHTHQRALDIVRKNGYGTDVVQVISTDCVVCLTEAVGPFSLELCGHTYCLQCIAQRIKTSVEKKEVPITCCADGCNKLIALEDILNLMFDEISIKYPHFWNEKLQSMLKVCSEQAVIARRDMTFCTRPDCSAVIKLTGKRPDEVYECSRCQMQMCAGCFNPPHPGRTCTAEAALRGSVDLSLQEWVNTGRGENEVKRCPTANCQAVIEKERGCNHMQCKMCKVHFCWLCCSTADTDKAIYAHMGDHHGGTGGEWAFLDQHQGPEVAFDAPPGFEHMANRANVVFIDGQPVFLEEEW